MLLHQISVDEENEEGEAKWFYVEVYQSTNAGYLSGGSWIAYSILEKMYKNTGWEEVKGKELTLDELVCIQSM